MAKFDSGDFWWLAVTAIFLWCGANLLVSAYTHEGPGYVPAGGTPVNPETGDGDVTEWRLADNDEYRRHKSVGGWMMTCLGVVGLGLWIWALRNEREKERQRMAREESMREWDRIHFPPSDGTSPD